MGLEGLEFVMAIEEKFDFEITDRDFYQCQTLGDFYQLVCSRINLSGYKRCRTMSEFYRLRRFLISEFSFDRNRITPSTKLEDLFPSNERYRIWESMQQGFSGGVQGLEHLPLFGVWKILGLWSLFLCSLTCASTGNLLWSIGILPYILWLIFAPKPTVFPCCYTTVGDVIRIKHENFNSWVSVYSKDDSDGRIWDDLILVLNQMFRVDPSTLTKDTNIYKDLGFG